MNVDIEAAKTHLSRLIDQVNAGEQVVLTHEGRPVARLVPAAERSRHRKLGTLRGQVWMSDDFDVPLSDDLLDRFGDKDRE